MKIPALRGKIGGLTYYVTTLTFKQISENVVKIQDELHESKVLQDLIQRSITKNYLSIKSYILNQPEVFFSSIVLAVYDDYPDWQEIEVKYDNEETFKMGLLDFPGRHTIFPVDGQHRVEGIKEALKVDETVGQHEIGVIFIGHSESPEEKRKTRRLFTTLNRYAKPVSLRDIIALDEDDTTAIITRELIENHVLFKGDKIVDSKNKAIPVTNKIAFTSIIAFYQANLEVCKYHYTNTTGNSSTKKNIDEFLKFRPSDEVIISYSNVVTDFWNQFKDNITDISSFLDPEIDYHLRDLEAGGNLLFRPIGLLPFVKATLRIRKKFSEESFEDIFRSLNEINLDINNRPWINVVWNDIQKRMIMNGSTLTYLLLLYLYDTEILTEKELVKLKEGYASRIGIEDENEIDSVLDEL